MMGYGGAHCLLHYPHQPIQLMTANIKIPAHAKLIYTSTHPRTQGSLPWQTLRDLLLTGKALLVLLVDSRLLPRAPQPTPPGTAAGGSQQPPQQQPASGSAATTPLATGAYCGHYILLTGYRAHPPAFFYKDPARPTGDCSILRDVFFNSCVWVWLGCSLVVLIHIPTHGQRAASATTSSTCRRWTRPAHPTARMRTF